MHSGSGVERTYYLHYRKYWKYIDDTEMSSQWVISINTMSTEYAAWCDEEDLVQCVEGKWMVDEPDDDDAVASVVDASMVVSNSACANTNDAVGDEDDNSTNVTLIVAIVLIVAFVVMIGVGVFVYFRMKNKQFRKASKAVEIKDEEEDADDEVVVEYEMETHETTQ